MNVAQDLEITPSGTPVGAKVSGIDFSHSISEATRMRLLELWGEHLVLLFPAQSLDDEQLLAVADVFGGRQVAGSRAFFLKAGHRAGASARVADKAAITVISNYDDNGKLAAQAGGNSPLKWHTDNSYVETPPAGSLLHAHSVPKDGGGLTSFSNQYLAYERLPDALKVALDGKHIRHDNTRNTTGALRPTFATPQSRDDITGPVHPAVRIHPLTGRRALYLGRHYEWPSSHVIELNDDDSEALLTKVWECATQPDLAWTHSWRKGDLLLWDNRCTMHARTAVDHTQDRVMHRALVKGEAVVSAWQ